MRVVPFSPGEEEKKKRRDEQEEDEEELKERSWRCVFSFFFLILSLCPRRRACVCRSCATATCRSYIGAARLCSTFVDASIPISRCGEPAILLLLVGFTPGSIVIRLPGGVLFLPCKIRYYDM